MEVTADVVKNLRERTGLGIMDCKNALREVGGDLEKAVEFLRKKGAMKAEKRSGRETSEGRIGTYIHNDGKLAVLVELKCETDFVAKNDEFNELARNIAMHIAGSSPICIRREDVPQATVDKEREIFAAEVDAKKPAEVRNKIVEGKLNKFYADNCLLEQPYVKDDSKTVGDLVKEAISKMGENVTVARFFRMRVGES